MLRQSPAWQGASCLILLSFTLLGCNTPQIGGPAAPSKDPKAGLLTLPSGKTVYVYPFELSYTGNASYRWPNGRIYQGQWVNGLAQGRGAETTPDGQRYSGNWLAGMREGKGVLELPDKSRYEGDFHENARSGMGVLSGVKGSYDGEWRKDLPDGQGVFTYSDGSRYQGHWSRGRRSGVGRYNRLNGSEYNGDWVSDMPHGFGKVSEANGVTYDGQWVRGKRQGYGIGLSAAQVNYQGLWIGNKRNGYGRETRPDGAVYLGEWHDDKRQGQGVGTRLDGNRYEGYWADDVPSGPGTRTDSTGIVIAGLWQGAHISSGILTLPGGKRYSGTLYDDDNQAVDNTFLAWLKEAADQGNAYAQLLLGIAYSQYQSPTRDLNEATRWLSQSASKGIPKAEFLLGEIFLQQDDTRTHALELLLQAAKKHHSGANLQLGTLYQLGQYLPKNHVLARKYYEEASAKGNIVARNNLAWLLATSPDGNVRDGQLAVELARPIAFLFNSWGYMDTLAAALAERGDWQQAVAMQRRAVKLAKDSKSSTVDGSVLQQMQQRITLFENRQPFREP